MLNLEERVALINEHLQFAQSFEHTVTTDLRQRYTLAIESLEKIRAGYISDQESRDLAQKKQAETEYHIKKAFPSFIQKISSTSKNDMITNIP